MRLRLSALAALACVTVFGCEHHTTLTGPAPPPPPPPPPGSTAVLVGAGDIADCSSGGAEATAALLDGIAGTVFTAGDNAYSSGSTGEFADCYDPTWGRHKARTRPAPGNHDYNSSAAAPYYAYFGSNAGPAAAVAGTV